MNFGLPEMLVILLIVLLLFGSTRLPKLSRSIGQSARDLREGFNSQSPASKSKKPENSKPEDKNKQKKAKKE